jgi:hypothetical protein
MILFLDFDGVLHPDQAYMTKGGVALRCDGHNLFEHAELLADLLEPYPHVEIVLSTSWVPQLSFHTAKTRLPDRLQAKIIDATFDPEREEKIFWLRFPRYGQIESYVERHGLDDWLSIDDDDFEWPDDKRHHLIHTDEWGGIGMKESQDELIAKIKERTK